MHQCLKVNVWKLPGDQNNRFLHYTSRYVVRTYTTVAACRYYHVHLTDSFINVWTWYTPVSFACISHVFVYLSISSMVRFHSFIR